MQTPEMITGRFVMVVGSIGELFPQAVIPDGGFCIWDRQENKPVVTVHAEYANALCLETATPTDSPFTNLEKWLNEINNECLQSENIVPTRSDLQPIPLP